MKVIYVGVLKKAKPAIELSAATHLKSYGRWLSGTAGQFATLSAQIIAERFDDDNPTVFRDNRGKGKDGDAPEASENRIYAKMSKEEKFSGIVAIVIADQEYPERVAFQLLEKVFNEFLIKHPKRIWENSDATLPFPELTDYIEKYQDPEKADPITKITKELDETKAVLHKTIESVLERGEKIDSLVAKSENLSWQSKAFYTQAKKQNSCCVVM